MEIPKAIEILTLDLQDPGSINYSDRAAAQQLAIQALQTLNRLHDIYLSNPYALAYISSILKTDLSKEGEL